MKVLCLGWSDDFVGDAPPEARGYGMAAAMYNAATGETIDWVLKRVVPSPELPGIVERWLEKERPDAVLFRVNPFFINYTSVPIKLQTKAGAVGARAARWGLKVAANRRRSGHLWFRTLRRGSRKLLGGATYLEPDAVIEATDETLRRVVRREGIDILISGAHAARVTDEWMARERAESRLAMIGSAAEATSRRIGAHYQHFPTPLSTADVRPMVGFDGIHGNDEFQVFHGLLDARLLIRLWHTHREPADSLRFDLGSPDDLDLHVRPNLAVRLNDEQWERAVRLAGRAVVAGPVADGSANVTPAAIPSRPNL